MRKKSKSKSRSKAKAKAKRKFRVGAKAKAAPKAKRRMKTRASARAPSRPALRGAVPPKTAARMLAAAAPVGATAGGPIDTITRIASASPIARFNWPGRGVAPIGYIKGMAVVFARVLCKLRAGDPAAVEMAKKTTGDGSRDALAHYDDIFRGFGMNNDVSGPDTLRHLFVLMVGHGMRESSGKFCEGQDRSAPENQTAERAEAGLFQTSFDARNKSPFLAPLFAKYSANPAGFKEIFREGCSPCTAKNLENFGTGPGRDFQQLSKDSPAFAAEVAAVTLRSDLGHYGPIKARAAQVKPDCDAMFQQVQQFIDASPDSCPMLV